MVLRSGMGAWMQALLVRPLSGCIATPPTNNRCVNSVERDRVLALAAFEDQRDK